MNCGAIVLAVPLIEPHMHACDHQLQKNTSDVQLMKILYLQMCISESGLLLRQPGDPNRVPLNENPYPSNLIMISGFNYIHLLPIVN